MLAVNPQSISYPPDNFTDAVERAQPQQIAQAQTNKKNPDDDSLTFSDIIDAINPLQHIPVISTIYRALTGDEISAPARIAGDALFGGPIGLVSGIANSIIEHETGQDIGAHMVASITGGEAAPTASDDNAAVIELADTEEQPQSPEFGENFSRTVDKAPLVRVSASSLPVTEYQWEEVSTSLPGNIVSATPAPQPVEHLPWTADMPKTPTVLDADKSLAPLPWLATIGSGAPANLPESQHNAAAIRNYAPYPATSPADIARSAIDLNA